RSSVPCFTVRIGSGRRPNEEGPLPKRKGPRRTENGCGPTRKGLRPLQTGRNQVQGGRIPIDAGRIPIDHVTIRFRGGPTATPKGFFLLRNRNVFQPFGGFPLG